MALPLTETDKFLLLSAVGAPESRDRIVALLDLAGTGNMTGPASATDNALVRFDGATGALVKNSSAILTNAGALSGLLSVASSGAYTGGNGSSAAPTFSFVSDPDTGVFRRGANDVGISANATEILSISTSGLSVLAGQTIVPAGSAAAPSYSFSGDLDTGIFRSTANVLEFATSGTQRGSIGASGGWVIGSSGGTQGHSILGDVVITDGTAADVTPLKIDAGTVTGLVRSHLRNSDATRYFELQGDFTGGSEILRIQSDAATLMSLTRSGDVTAINGTFTISSLRAAAGSAAVPSHSFSTDPDTGAYRVGANEYGISTGGSLKLTVDSGGNVVIGVGALATTATDGFIYASSSAGAPTGVPTTHTGRVPIHIDDTNGRFYAYYGGAWHFVALT